jgi:eukaryotic-like serine/threonine-protein kinase
VSEDPLIGTILADRYRVDRLVGEGAMGRVYQAEHILMRKRVALKVLHPELMTVPEIVQRFEREARAAAHIEHPHVAGATDFGKLADGGIYLVLEFIEGLPLSQIIEGGPLRLDRVLNIARQIASALEVAHERGIVHRDLKPDNLLLLHTDEESDFIKVLDFGIAKVPAEPHEGGRPITQVGMVYGTPEYMAPEQALGQDVDARADLYALGVVMYELLTGRRPYVGPAVGLLGQQLSTPLPKMAKVAKVKVPLAVEQLVVDLLAPDPSKRTASATVLRQQLEALLSAYHEGKFGSEGRGTLLSVSFEEVSTRIEHVAQNLPKPVGRLVKSRVSRAALLAIAFGLVGVAGAILLVGALTRDPSDRQGEKLVLSEPPPPVLDVPPEETFDWEVLLAQAREGGVPALKKLADEHPTEGVIHAELSLSYSKEKLYEEAVDSARVALALDPKLNENAKIAGALFRAAQSVKARAAAFRLLEGAMGSAGVGIIYDLAHTEGLTQGVTQTARQALKNSEVRASAGPALVLLLELEEAKTCEETKRLVQRAVLVGDKRALPILEKMEVTSGCGRKKGEDCFPCLRSDDNLKTAIATIKQRVTLVEPDTKPAAN